MDLNDLKSRLASVRQRIISAEREHGRPPGSVTLLAVSKTQPVESLHTLFEAGQCCFGESYLQEALPKIAALSGYEIEWHYIGPIQSNKTRSIAENFSWVHSVDRIKIAQRLSEQRNPSLTPLNICLQVNISNEPSKSGVRPDSLAELAHAVSTMPCLRLRGLMAIPAPSDVFEEQQSIYRRVKELQSQLIKQGLSLDTLSMGMSSDIEAAISEGATIVRVGSALFGPRTVKQAAGKTSQA